VLPNGATEPGDPDMKVMIIGGGVIGVTSAWYLARAGHEVTVLERNSEIGHETSFANGGQVSWGSGNPWAAPGVPKKALRWLFERHAPLIVHPSLDRDLWRWAMRLLRECSPERYRRNKERQFRLARYSHACLEALRSDTRIRYSARNNGILAVFRTPEEAEAAQQNQQLARQLGIQTQLFDRTACITQEPALSHAADIIGGLLYPDDESGDCRQFTEALAERAETAGVKFQLHTAVLALVPAGNRIEQALTSAGTQRADAYVLAAGSYSPGFVRPLGIDLPIYPVKGYSITTPVVDNDHAPTTSITDETHKVVVSRLGKLLRVAGMAELAGFDHMIHPRRIETLKYVLNRLFPNATDSEDVVAWSGLRPMTPDNPPVIGTSPYGNLFLNTGHGTLGWTMACGSGQVLADLVSGRSPEIDLDGLTIERFLGG